MIYPSLHALLEGLVPEDTGGADQAVTGVTDDSRTVIPGNIFVSISGFEKDGHRYVDEAIEKGAAAVLSEKELGQKSVPVIRVQNTRRMLALLSARFWGYPSRTMCVVGVTGTNGKTSVTFLLESIFKAAGFEPGLLGTLYYRWTGRTEKAPRTTPGACTVQHSLYEMRQSGARAAVLEVSSHALALDRVTGVEFDAAVFTNLSRDHLDFHQDMEEYGRAKARLFSMLNSDGVGIVNADDPASRWMETSASARIVRFGTSSRAQYRIKKTGAAKDGMRIHLSTPSGEMELSTPLFGFFNAMNCTAAAAAALELKIKPADVFSGIKSLQRVPGRMESLKAPGGFTVIVDYAHTPDAIARVASAVRESTPSRLIIVFGCGGDRDRGKRPEMGKTASALADLVFVTSDNPRSEEPEAIIRDILGGIENKEKIRIVTDRREAIRDALQTASQGDSVIIAGKGHEDYQEIGGKRFPFQDMEIVREWLGMEEGA